MTRFNNTIATGPILLIDDKAMCDIKVKGTLRETGS